MTERIEVRRNPDGTIDEVLLMIGQRCVFHLEQLDANAWYFGLYPDGDETAEQFDIHSTKRVTVRDARDER